MMKYHLTRLRLVLQALSKIENVPQVERDLVMSDIEILISITTCIGMDQPTIVDLKSSTITMPSTRPPQSYPTILTSSPSISEAISRKLFNTELTQ